MNHQLLVAVDGGPTTTHTVAYVGRACAGSAAPDNRVVLFHVLPSLPPDVEAGHRADAAHARETVEARFEEQGRHLLDGLRDQLIRAGVDPDRLELETEENDGDVPAQIRAAAQRHGCDTIVIGRRGQSMVSQFFAGSVAEHLLRKPIGLTVWVIE